MAFRTCRVCHRSYHLDDVNFPRLDEKSRKFAWICRNCYRERKQSAKGYKQRQRVEKARMMQEIQERNRQFLNTI